MIVVCVGGRNFWLFFVVFVPISYFKLVFIRKALLQSYIQPIARSVVVHRLVISSPSVEQSVASSFGRSIGWSVRPTVPHSLIHSLIQIVSDLDPS